MNSPLNSLINSPAYTDFAVICDEKAEFYRGVKEALPVMLGFIPFAMVLGASAVEAGFKWYELGLLTTTNLAGGSEFAVVRLWDNPLNIGLIVLMATLVNSRHIIMGGGEFFLYY